MAAVPPDHLSNDPDSKFFDEAVLERGIGVRFNGAEKTNVDEYSVSEGWIRVTVGKTVNRRGKPMTLKLKGKVEVYYKEAVDSVSDTSVKVPPA